MATVYQTRIKHAWYAGHSFDIWHVEAGTQDERHVLSIDAATVTRGTLGDCQRAWIHERERVLRAHEPGGRR